MRTSVICQTCCVRRTQQVGQITDVRVAKPTIDHQQPGPIPGGGGPRGDRLARQLEVEVVAAHGPLTRRARRGAGRG